MSCRSQIEHVTARTTTHLAELLAARIAPGHVWRPTPAAVEELAAAAD